MTDQLYALVVIGSGPAGQKAAINAAKLGKRVLVIDRAGMVAGFTQLPGRFRSATVVHQSTAARFQVKQYGMLFFI